MRKIVNCSLLLTDHDMTSCLSPSLLLRLALSDKEIQKLYASHNQQLNKEKRERLRRHENDGAAETSHHYTDSDFNDNNEYLSTIEITPSMFIDICPSLLVQLEQRSCSDVTKLEIGKIDKEFRTGQRLNFFYYFFSCPILLIIILAWIYATISIIIISMCGLVGVAIVPFTKSKCYQDILCFLVAIAVGTLCGDALMVNLVDALIVDALILKSIYLLV